MRFRGDGFGDVRRLGWILPTRFEFKTEFLERTEALLLTFEKFVKKLLNLPERS